MADKTLRPDIELARAKAGISFGSKREMRRLPDHLWENERVLLLAPGMYGGGTGLLALTDQRLIFTFEGVARKATEDFPFSKITSVQQSSGLAYAKITIHASGNKAEVTNVLKKAAKQIVDHIRAVTNGQVSPLAIAAGVMPTPPLPPAPASQSAPPPPVPAAQFAPPPPPPAPDPYTQIAKLAELHQAGILTDEEFSAKKAQILGI